jgi:3-keto-L-gulonate-6-phosphate decarboxylase
VQISLDLTDLKEALSTAALARRAGVDWLEAGTPLILAEGLHGVRALRAAFPGVPIVADLKTMDGGYLEAEMMARAGATHVVVMARSHPETREMRGPGRARLRHQGHGRQPGLRGHGGRGAAARGPGLRL